MVINFHPGVSLVLFFNIDDLNGRSKSRRPISTKVKFLFLVPDAMKIAYQCLTCGKKYDTQDKAEKCHDSPIQAFEQGVTGFSKRKGLIGN